MAVNPRIECFSRELVTEYCQGSESSTVYTAPPFFVKTLPGRSNRNLPRLWLHMHAQEIISTFLTWDIYLGLCLPKALRHDSGHTKYSKCCQSWESTKVWAFGEFSTSTCQETHCFTAWHEGFLSRRESRSLYNPSLELHPLVFTEQFLHCRYHSIRDFDTICYTTTVNEFSNPHAGYKQL